MISDRTSRLDNVSLRRLTLTISIATVVIGAGLLLAVAYAGWSMNAVALKLQQELIENALDQTVTRVLNEQKSIALWDEGAARVASDRLDLAWLDVEYGLFLNEAYGHGEVYVLNRDNQPVWAFRDGKRANTSIFNKRQGEVMPLIREIRGGPERRLHSRDRAFAIQQRRSYNVLEAAKQGRWAANLLVVDGQPAVVSAFTIIPIVDLSLRTAKPSVLVSIVPINSRVIDDIGQSLLIPDLHLGSADQADNKRGMKTIVADDGRVAGTLVWRPRQPGDFLLTFILPLVALATLAVGMTTEALLRRLARASAELAASEADARHLALHDSLSALPNRLSFSDSLNNQLAACGPDAPDWPVVAYIDIDRFKDINDTLGHRAGDELVCAAGTRLHSILAPGDLLARFGGDEFAVMPRPASTETATQLGQRLVAAFDEPFDFGGQPIKVTASVGLAIAPAHGVSADELMRHADIALYRAKDEGRGRWVVFSDEMADAIAERRSIENDLREAIETDQLHMVYQPILSSATNDVIGVEALMRWRHPERGPIPPSTFIPIAESAGLMPDLGQWVLERSFADAARWPSLQVAINLSPAQLRHVELVPLLRRLIARHRIDPSRIVLEITESILLEATEHMHAMLAKIIGLGLRTALDDFGTGYSSLSYLRTFKFHKIKIDRSFVHDVTLKQQAMTIVQAVVALGRGLGMEIVAEGIETESEASLMRYAGCTELQGYLFSRPLNVEAIDARFAPQAAIARRSGRLHR